MTQRIILQGLTPLALQTISLSNSTAAGLNSTSQTGHLFDISVETQAARMRCDSTAPTLTTGILVATGTYKSWQLPTGATFQRSTGTAKVTIQPYKWFSGIS
jgi:hypothetical protein